MRKLFSGMIFGFVVSFLSLPILWFNEGCAVDIAKSLDEAGGNTVTISANDSPSNYSGQLVHLTGRAEAADLRDPHSQLNISGPFLVLERSVSMYQYRERRSSERQSDAEGNSRSVDVRTYESEWSSSPIDSSKFEQADQYRNPSFPFENDRFHAESIQIGNFRFSEQLAAKIPAEQSLEINTQLISRLPPPLRQQAKVDGNRIFIGNDPANPEVGNMRIEYKMAPTAMELSVIGQIEGEQISAYRSSRGNEVLLLRTGSRSAEEMIQMAQDDNVARTWFVRFLGVALLFFGLRLILSPVSSPLRFIPVLGSAARAGITAAAALAAVAISFLIIAVAWIFYRPLLAIALLLVVAGAVGFLIWRSRSAAAGSTPAA